MSAEALPSWLPMCSCGHPAGDHASAGTRFPHPPRYGGCFRTGCKCDGYVEVNPAITGRTEDR